jgi:hypothetical protein
VSGFAVIDGILSPTLIRADGYALEFTPATHATWNLPPTTASKPMDPIRR